MTPRSSVRSPSGSSVRSIEQDQDKNPIPVSLTADLVGPAEAFEVERLAALLAAVGGIDGLELLNIRDLFERSQTIPGAIHRRRRLLPEHREYSAFPAVRNAAATLGDTHPSIVERQRETGSRGSFIVDHSRNVHSTARLHGAPYAPQIASDDWRGPRFFYNKSASSRESSWSRLRTCSRKGVNRCAGRKKCQEFDKDMDRGHSASVRRTWIGWSGGAPPIWRAWQQIFFSARASSAATGCGR